jgi:hypothetical protein
MLLKSEILVLLIAGQPNHDQPSNHPKHRNLLICSNSEPNTSKPVVHRPKRRQSGVVKLPAMPTIGHTDPSIITRVRIQGASLIQDPTNPSTIPGRQCCSCGIAEDVVLCPRDHQHSFIVRGSCTNTDQAGDYMIQSQLLNYHF